MNRVLLYVVLTLYFVYAQGQTSYDEGGFGGSFDEITGTFDERSGTFDETSGTFDERSGTFDETSGTFDETTGSFDETSGSFDETNGLSGEYSVWYNGRRRSTNMFIECSNAVSQPGIFEDYLHFDNVASYCDQSRDSKATMYIENTHGASKYECVWVEGTTIKGSHYTSRNSFWGTVEYRLISPTECAPSPSESAVPSPSESAAPSPSESAEKPCNGRCYAAHSTPWSTKCVPSYIYGCDGCPECAPSPSESAGLQSCGSWEFAVDLVEEIAYKCVDGICQEYENGVWTILPMSVSTVDSLTNSVVYTSPVVIGDWDITAETVILSQGGHKFIWPWCPRCN